MMMGIREQLDWLRLAEEVRLARGRRSQKDIHDSGGPSDTTMTKIEANTWQPTGKFGPTLDKLEIALGWPRGRAMRVLRGEEPDRVEEARSPAHDDDEFIAMRQVVSTMEALDPPARRRVLTWALDRYTNPT